MVFKSEDEDFLKTKQTKKDFLKTKLKEYSARRAVLQKILKEVLWKKKKMI